MTHPQLFTLLALLSVACSPAPPASSTPVLDISRAGSTAPALKPIAKPEAKPGSAGAHYLLGVLGQSGTPHCPERHGKREWRDIKPVIGFVPIGSADPKALSRLMGRPVIATGTAAAAPKVPPFNPTIDQFECPPFQARSDWRMTPRGLRLVREPRPNIEFFRVDALRQMTTLTVKHDGDNIRASFSNPLPGAIKDVALRIHYEGCYGKPGATQKTTKKTTLASGQTIALSEPSLLTQLGRRGPGRSSYRAFSVQVVATSKHATFDLDVPLSSLDAETSCPRRP